MKPTLNPRCSPLVAAVGAAMLALAAGCQREPSATQGIEDLKARFAKPDSPAVVQLAIAAAQTNELGQSVIALQEAKKSPGMTPDQLQSVEQASQSLVRELLRRAESGDAQAKADLQLIERTRSQ